MSSLLVQGGGSSLELQAGDSVQITVDRRADRKTWVRVLFGIIQDPKLTVEVLGEEWSDLQQTKTYEHRTRMGLVQGRSVWASNLGVEESIMLAGSLHRRQREAENRLKDLETACDLPLTPGRPGKIRGLDCWRMQWHRALVLSPDVLICDNPFEGVGLEEMGPGVLEEIDRLCSEGKLAVLWLIDSEDEVPLAITNHRHHTNPLPPLPDDDLLSFR